jgi:flavin reductase (DIM6/NTAB) family NADH-FMN oxidoreductase RutF
MMETFLITEEITRQAMRKWTTGITIVSARFEGAMHGMTVNSFTSLSLSPPLILVSIQQRSRTHDLILHSGFFGVSILDQNQREVSERFAGRLPDDVDRFAGLQTFTLSSGSPFITGGLSYLDCHVVQTLETGGNTLFIGEIKAVRISENGSPLIYHDQDYWKLGGRSNT